MPLAIGTRLGPYEILAPLGAGGMGEVYRARDPRLGRDVAIKVLPAAFSADPERLQRFEQEARAAAALNHPNILAVHDIGVHDGAPYIVSELLEGQTLRERVGRTAARSSGAPDSGSPASEEGSGSGGLSIRKATDYVVQIARGLAAAHDKGIVHRDLKPENVFVTTDGHVKILDFGLAKLTQLQAALAGVSQVPTGAVDTTPGTLLGTMGYMAPEQVRGQEVDHRADLFAFGAILYEMLSGQRAFRGATPADTISAILDKDPPEQPLAERHVPPVLARVVDRCLEKNPAARFRSTHDLAFALEALSSESVSGTAALPSIGARRRSRERVVWASVATVATVVAIALGIPYLRLGPTTERLPMRFAIAPPQNVIFSNTNNQTVPAVSPDGRRLAFIAPRAGTQVLWVRALDALDAQPLAGTENATYPFWSPDSRTLGFFTGVTLKTIDAAGGPVHALCSAQVAPAGGTWSSGGVIVFAGGGLFSVSASGGSPEPLSRSEEQVRLPTFLPDGRRFLYWTTPSNTIWLGSLDSAERTRLLTADSQAVYAAPGSLLFVRQGTLMAQPFDARAGTLTGEAILVAEQVLSAANTVAAFAVSETGTLAYRTGTLSVTTQLMWVDRSGKPLGTVGSSNRYRNHALSPDGTRVAVEITDPTSRSQDIWLVELARGVITRFTFDAGNDIYPVWSPDSTWIMFGSDRGGVFNLYQKRANGTGSEELVLKSAADMTPYSWAPDGRTLVYRTTLSALNMGILPLAGPRTPQPLLQSTFTVTTGQVSPDGRWLAYQSNESGPREIYVQSFPTPGGGKWQISKEGGIHPRWRGDGREVIYYGLNGRLMAVPVTSGTALEVGTAVPLFQARLLVGTSTTRDFRHQYEMTRDAQKFLLNVPLEDASPSTITVVTNWTPIKK